MKSDDETLSKNLLSQCDDKHGKFIKTNFHLVIFSLRKNNYCF